MSDKVYALFFRKPLTYKDKYELKISSDDIWAKELPWLSEESEGVVLLNDCVYVSLNRHALIKKAYEIKSKWIREQELSLGELKMLDIGTWNYTEESNTDSLGRRIIKQILEEYSWDE